MSRSLLVLPGGGPHAIMVHLAILEQLEKSGFDFQHVLGISAGAIAGYCYRKIGAVKTMQLLSKYPSIIKKRPFWMLRLLSKNFDYIIDRTKIEEFLNEVDKKRAGFTKGFSVDAYNEATRKLVRFDEPTLPKAVIASAAARPFFDGIDIGGTTYSDAGPISNIPDYDFRAYRRIVVVIPEPQTDYKKKRGIFGSLIHNWEAIRKHEYDKEIRSRENVPNIYFLKPKTTGSRSWFSLDWKTYEETRAYADLAVIPLQIWWSKNQ